LPLEGNKSERLWDRAFLGLSMEGCRAAVTIGVYPDCSAL
jgi:hypothetical protein